jgi:hypothetical protein
MKFKIIFLIFLIFISNAVAFEINRTVIKLDLILSVITFFIIFDKINLKSILLPFIFLLNGLMTSIKFGDNTVGVFLNYVMLVFFILFFENIKEAFSFESLFKVYVSAAKFCVFFGVIQIISFFLSFLFNLNYFVQIYDPRWLLNTAPITYAGILPKLSSFFTEPSYLSCFLLPYLLISFNNLKTTFYSYFLLFSTLLVFVFTFSSIGIASLSLYFVSKFSNFKQFFSIKNYFFILLIILFVFNNESIYLRFFQLGESDLGAINLSSMIYVLNLNLILSSFNWQYLWGYGLDTYQIVVGHYYDSSLIAEGIQKIYEKPDLMINGAPTLFFRFFVEFGVIGYFFLLKKFKFDYLKSPFFFGFLAFCLRSGEYLRFDTLFFLFMFISFKGTDILYLSNKNNKYNIN